MAFDYKKKCKEFYAPPKVPTMIDIPPMNYLAVRGNGNPNEVNGEYSRALNLLYPIAYTLKMSNKSDYKIEGFFEYVVPPLEGFWWQDGIKGVDYSNKESFCWISIIRLPDFITKKDFDWAINKVTEKKKTDFSSVEFFTYNEGLCVQCMHIGSYDSEPETVQLMEKHAIEQGNIIDISDERYHHEIYLSDPRKTAPDKLKTVIRHPVKKKL